MSSGYQKMLDDFDKERNTIAFYKTRGFKELWRNIGDLVRKEEIQKRIKILRKKFKIPILGFTIKESPWNHPPKDWHYYQDRTYMLFRVRDDIIEICKECSLLPNDWMDVFEKYLFYNKLLLHMRPNAHNLCFVCDSITKTDSVGHQANETDLGMYPISLQISPYASKRNIQDYINKIYTTEIKPLQDKYKKPDVKIGKTRKRDSKIRQINDFIYENQDWEPKRLITHIKEKFNKILLQSEISKAISIENKTRN